jgi:type III restriction enzyme
MKLHFEPNLDYQLQAIEAVCDLFRGQEVCRTDFTVTRQAVVRSQDFKALWTGSSTRPRTA